MGVKNPVIYEIAPDTYAINEFGLAAMYLLVGGDKALLIDTGCGICRLPDVIKKLTDKPLTVALTHAHLDHCGGIGWFDEVYLNEKDFDRLRGVSVDEIKRYADIFGKAGGYQVYEYNPEDTIGFDKMPELKSIGDGTVIDLGGRSVEVFEIPGHTKGGIVFVDDKNRIVYSGDACNTNLLATECSVEETQEAIEKFKSLSPRFDQNYNGHVGFMGYPSCLSQPKSVADDLLTICRMLRSGEAEGKEWKFLWETMTKLTYGKAGLSYNPKWINKEDCR